MNNTTMNFANHTFSTGQSNWLRNPHEASQLIGWIVAVLTTTCFGTVANVLFLLSMIIHRPLRKSSSCALIIHCIALNLYITAVTVPSSTIPVYLGAQHYLPLNYCHYQTIFTYLPYIVACFAESFVALHRLAAMVIPRYFCLLIRKPAIAGMIILPWVLAMTLSVFPTAEIGVKFVRSNISGGCAFVSTNGKGHVMLLYTTFATYIPTAVMGISYLIILVITFRKQRARKSSLALQRRLEISRTLFFSYVWHCVTIYPTIFLLAFYPKIFSTNFALQLGIRWLTSSFGAINPVFYWASSGLFQNGVKEVLCCRWMQRPPRRVNPDHAVAKIALGSRNSAARRQLHSASYSLDPGTFTKY